jgi:hypothetical protein
VDASDDPSRFPRVGALAKSLSVPNNPKLGFIRIFFYVTGFERHNGNLKVVPGQFCVLLLPHYTGTLPLHQRPTRRAARLTGYY